MKRHGIPEPVVLLVGELIGRHYFNHREIERIFVCAGAPGGAPPGTCVDKAREWLRACDRDPSVDPFQVLGSILEGYMEGEIDDLDVRGPEWKRDRERLERVLGRYGLSYHQGGRILGTHLGAPARSLREVLRGRDFAAVEREFERALAQVQTDPPAAVTSACAILESFCKVFIEDEKIPPPKDMSLKPLWHTVRDHLGLRPEVVEEQDLRAILGGLASVADGIGALRTHAGSAHGRGRRSYRIEARHARLAIHAAHTLVVFGLETWAERRARLPPRSAEGAPIQA